MKKLKKSFKDFFKYYLLVFTVILLTVIIQTIIQYSLKNQERNSALINIAGKQRMLSQKVLANFYECRFLEGNYSDLKVALERLYRTNLALQEGNSKIGLQALENQEIQTLFDSLNQHLNFIHLNLSDLEKLKVVPYAELRSETTSFLTIMDSIVNLYQKIAEEEIRTLMIIELELAFATLLIILLEVLFIVNPAIKKITIQNKKLREISWYQTQAFSSHIKNLKGLEHVLKLEKRMEYKEEILECMMNELEDLEEVSKDMVETLENTTS